MVTIFGVETKVSYWKNVSKFRENCSIFTWFIPPKQILRPADGQTLISRMATKLTVVLNWKGYLSKKEKFIKIGAFFQKLSLKIKIK